MALILVTENQRKALLEALEKAKKTDKAECGYESGYYKTYEELEKVVKNAH